MICHQIRLRDDDSFSYWLEKKAQDIFCSHMWAWVFRVKRCTVGMRNLMAKIGLETNSSGKFDKKRKSSIATMNLLAQIICSNLMVFVSAAFACRHNDKL